MKNKTIFVLIASLFIFAGCTDEGENMQETSKLMVRMTDSPAEYEEVNIDLKEVLVHSDQTNAWVNLEVNQGIYNLLDYTAGIDTMIASAEISSGKISQIRLVLGENNTIKTGGVVYPLNTPSAQQSGLKLNINEYLVSNIPYTLLLDFDAARSIVKTGSNEYILKPVIRVIVNTPSGSISGNVLPVDAQPAVYAISGTDTFGTYTDTAGFFKVQGLIPGMYNLFLDAKPAYNDTTLNNITVVAGVNNDVGTIDLNP